MFPIIPTHMLNGSPSTSIAKMTSSNTSYSNAFWDIWTEDFLRRKYISATSNECGIDRPTDLITEVKTRDSKRSFVKMETNSNTERIQTGSYALETIPKDSKTRSFECIDVSSGPIAKCKSFISIDASGYITNDQKFNESAWLRSLTLAHDTYSHNAQLEITTDHRLRVKIVKNLVIDEEIQLWFADEVLAILSIPFLTPANILGKNCYKCIECNKTYENPNPLKIHLATKCNQLTMNDLWMRVNSILPLKSYTLSQPIESFRHLTSVHQSPENPAKRQSFESPDRLRQSTTLPFVPSLSSHFQSTSSQSNNSPMTSAFHHFPIQNVQQLSAFRPVPMSLSPPQMHQFATHSSHPFHQHPAVSRSIPTSTTNTVSQGEKVVAAAAAQLETIVSNMGTSKQGHICIYCGKLYSRKYGLKIHIRTHTGFKPLKCKYCLRPFGDPSNLNKHIRLHVQEKSLYKCHVCSKILVRRRDLLRHMNIKHNIGETATDAHFRNECDNSNDNTTVSSVNELNETNSSRSNSVNSDVACDISSNDEAANEDDDFDVRVDVD